MPHKMTTIPVIYPSAIARAVCALDELPAFREMPDGYLRVLIRIIKKINVRKPLSAVVAARTTIAKESGKSVETVQRVVRWLEEQGMIERAQKARQGLRGSSSPITPKLKLLESLGLTDADGTVLTSNNLRGQHAAPTPSGSNRVADEPSKPDRSSDFIRIEGKAIPCDLAWLAHKQGLSATAILKLMSISMMVAKQPLSRVVQATSQYLSGLRGGALFAYILKLLSSGRDFAWQTNQVQQQHIAAQQRERLADKAAELDGQRFVSRKDASTTYEVMATGYLRVINAGVSVVKPLTEAFLEALSAGKVRPAIHQVFA